MEFYFTKKKTTKILILFLFFTRTYLFILTLCIVTIILDSKVHIFLVSIFTIYFRTLINFQHLFVFIFEIFYLFDLLVFWYIPIQETEVSYLLLFPLFLFLERCLANKSLKSSFNKLLGVAFLWPNPNLSLPPRPLILPPSSDIASNGILIPVEFKPRASPKKCIQNRRTHWANVSW